MQIDNLLWWAWKGSQFEQIFTFFSFFLLRRAMALSIRMKKLFTSMHCISTGVIPKLSYSSSHLLCTRWHCCYTCMQPQSRWIAFTTIIETVYMYFLCLHCWGKYNVLAIFKLKHDIRNYFWQLDISLQILISFDQIFTNWLTFFLFHIGSS